jgi:hypothetical protein
MIGIRAQLDRLRSYRTTLLRSALPKMADPERSLEPFLEHVLELEERTSGRTSSAPAADSLYSYRSEWTSLRPHFAKLSRRAIRVLCSDPETLDDPEFVAGLGASGKTRESHRWAERLLVAYDLGWTKHRAERWAYPIRDAFEGHDRLSTKATRFLKTEGLLSPTAPEILAAAAIDDLTPPADIASRYQLALGGQLLEATLASLSGTWRRLLGKAKTAERRRLLVEFGFKTFVKPQSVDAQTRANALSAMILAVEPSEDTIEWLRSSILTSRQLGDPRKPGNRNNWALVKREALQRFKQWLAKEDLRFFFDAVMARTPDPHGRREFWDEWLDHERLVDSNVALSTLDESYLRSRGLIKKDAVYSRVEGGQNNVSAFLLRFRRKAGEMIAIEFSQAGNAAYFHDGAKFDGATGGIHRPAFHINRDLKNKRTELPAPGWLGDTWDWHREGWEYNFREALSFFLDD